MNGATITPTEMSGLTAMAAALQQQSAILPLLESLPAPVPGGPAPGLGGLVDAFA